VKTFFGMIIVFLELCSVQSRYSSLEIFNSIVEISSSYDNASCCIVGDFNARSGVLSDFTDFDIYVVTDNFNNDITDALNRNNLLDLGFPVDR
jgi:hypothetical protein